MSGGWEHIKDTTSRCPVCLLSVPAAVRVAPDGSVMMVKSCPEHGEQGVRVARDSRWYHTSIGNREAGCCGAGCGCEPDAFETLSTCVALIEIVDSCNLACPTCYAASPVGVNDEVDCQPLESIVGRIESVLERKGSIDILQLSGGEPTLHPKFFDVLDYVLAEKRIGYVLINTNGVRLANDAGFRSELAARHTPGSFELYVQFDGPQEEGQRALRGADLRGLRVRAIDGCGELGIPTTLAMVVNAETLPFVGDAVGFGLERPHCRGITLQPEFGSGRTPVRTPAPVRLHTGEIIDALVAQKGELLSESDFTPLPCGDPNCHTIGYILRLPEGPVGLGSVVALDRLQGFLNDRVDYRLEDLARCGCDAEPLGELLKGFELSPDLPFRIFIKPFMDAWDFDQDRIDRCCTHVIRRDGSLDSFCRYYLEGGSQGQRVGLTVGRRDR